MEVESKKTALQIRCENRDDLLGLEYNIINTIKSVSSIWWDHLFEDARVLEPSLTKDQLQAYHDEYDKLHGNHHHSVHASKLPMHPVHNPTNEATDTSATAIESNPILELEDEVKPSKSNPPPFDFCYVEKNHEKENELVGTNICIYLKDICKPGASVYVIMYGLYGETLEEIGRTESQQLNSEEDMSNSAVNYDGDLTVLHMQFHAMLPKIPEDPKCRAVSFDICQELHDSKSCICRVCFNPREASSQRGSGVFKLQMFMLHKLPHAIKPAATLGLMIMSSRELRRFRDKVNSSLSSSMLRTKPYAEKIYSAESVGGTTFVLEQLYASRCSAAVPAALLNLLHLERQNQFESFLSKMKEVKERKDKEASSKPNNNSTNLLETTDYDEIDCPKSFTLLQDAFRDYDAMVDRMNRTCKHALGLSEESSVEAFRNELQSPNIPTVEGSISYGGNVLRKSKSRNNECYQAMTTNLNIHIVSSQWIPYSKTTGGQCLHNYIDVSPSVTLGCPTAHYMKFKSGGLRNQFKRIVPVDDRLEWIKQIQDTSPEEFIAFVNDFMGKTKSKKEGGKANKSGKVKETKNDQTKVKTVKKFFDIPDWTVKMEEHDKEDEVYNLKWADVLLKKFKLAERVDVCSCQVLGVAIALVKLVVFLAANVGGSYVEVLTRSLHTGFLIQLQSLLSVASKEMFMIEDLDIAVLWLSLVKVRFRTDKNPGSVEGIYISRGLGVDTTGGLGDIIVDIEIDSDKERAVIEKARRTYEKLNLTPPIATTNTNEGGDTDRHGHVLASSSLFGVLFTQGINEMQDLTNYGDKYGTVFSKKSHEENTEQDNINKESLKRFHEGFFMKVLEFNKEYFKGTNTGSSEKALRIEEESGSNYGEDNHLQSKFNALKEAIGKGKKPEKHVDILYKSSILCRELGGTIALLCKSGKDRTSMAVTLDSTRELVERMGVVRGEDLLRVKRTVGVRRMNVFANTGQSNYAFNGFQVNHFPKCYQAPSKTYAGNVAS